MEQQGLSPETIKAITQVFSRSPKFRSHRYLAPVCLSTSAWIAWRDDVPQGDTSKSALISAVIDWLWDQYNHYG